MTTTLSSKGQIVLPKEVRTRLQLQAGCRFGCRVEGDSIVLTPESVRPARAEFVTDPQTGLIVTQGDASVPLLESATVRALLADFP